jgi:hypothetical protein
LFPVQPHDRGGGLQPNSNGATLVDEGALGGNPLDDIFGGQNLRHSTALEVPLQSNKTRQFAAHSAQNQSLTKSHPALTVQVGPSVVLHLDGHDVQLDLGGEAVGKDAIGTSRPRHPNHEIKDKIVFELAFWWGSHDPELVVVTNVSAGI